LPSRGAAAANLLSIRVGEDEIGLYQYPQIEGWIPVFLFAMLGRIVGPQEFGLGLPVAVFVDATVVRALLVPALMAITGRYNWWLPARVARLGRVAPSPLVRPGAAGD